jgi:hypothetical protein
MRTGRLRPPAGTAAPQAVVARDRLAQRVGASPVTRASLKGAANTRSLRPDPYERNWRRRISRNCQNEQSSRSFGGARSQPRAAVQSAPLKLQRLSTPKVRHVAIGLGHLLAVTILIGPNRSTTIGLPLASLPSTP